jgi:hypothetical protein
MTAATEATTIMVIGLANDLIHVRFVNAGRGEPKSLSAVGRY